MVPQVKFGWLPDFPDHRDKLYRSVIPPKKLPLSIDLRPRMLSPAYDQGNLGSCTGNAIAGAIEYAMIAQSMQDWIPSRLFIYYNERVIEQSVGEDAGAMIRDGIKTVSKQGACPEALWPYDIGRYTVEPDPVCYETALTTRALKYERITSLAQMKDCLASKFPFVFGFAVYESFMSDTIAKTGVVRMPKLTEPMVGGHAVVAFGYNDRTKRFLVRNSWGPGWGRKGYFSLPYDYVTNFDMADDFWKITMVGA